MPKETYTQTMVRVCVMSILLSDIIKDKMKHCVFLIEHCEQNISVIAGLNSFILQYVQ